MAFHQASSETYICKFASHKSGKTPKFPNTAKMQPVTPYELSCSQVSDLIRKIQKAYVETLEELRWMDGPSKEKAREKVKEAPRNYGCVLHTVLVASTLYSLSYTGHGDQRAHWLPGSHPAGTKPEA